MVLRARPWPIRCSFCALIISMLAMANSASASSSFFSALLSQMQSLRVGMQGERAEPSEEQPPAVELDFSEVDGAFKKKNY